MIQVFLAFRLLRNWQKVEGGERGRIEKSLGDTGRAYSIAAHGNNFGREYIYGWGMCEYPVSPTSFEYNISLIWLLWETSRRVFAIFSACITKEYTECPKNRSLSIGWSRSWHLEKKSSWPFSCAMHHSREIDQLMLAPPIRAVRGSGLAIVNSLLISFIPHSRAKKSWNIFLYDAPFSSNQLIRVSPAPFVRSLLSIGYH